MLCIISTAGHADETRNIQRGETIYSIAREYNLKVEQLLNINNISDPTAIRIGTELTIPGEFTATYRAQRGDTYYSIARQHDVAVADLLAQNDRASADVLKIGDELSIPSRDISVTRSAIETDIEAQPVSIRSQVADTSGGNDWPHNGTRSKIGGKFPAVIIHADAGDVVRAVAGGRVVYVGNNAAFGNVVFVQNGSGHIYIYGGQESTTVDAGDRLEIGAVIGRVAPARESNSPPRLYFSVWHNNTFIDPHNAPRG